MFTFGNRSSSQPGSDQALALRETNDSHFRKLGHVLIQLLLQILCWKQHIFMTVQPGVLLRILGLMKKYQIGPFHLNHSNDTIFLSLWAAMGSQSHLNLFPYTAHIFKAKTTGWKTQSETVSFKFLSTSAMVELKQLKWMSCNSWSHSRYKTQRLMLSVIMENRYSHL